MKVALAALSVSLFAVASPADAAPSCKKYFEPGSPGEKLLDCKFRGGVRPTRELGGKKYITVVGTCYDYDVVSLKKCGCRMFERASLCCGKGKAARTCHWRVGNSKWVDCKQYKQPKFGLTGDTETTECRQKLNAADCGKRVKTAILPEPGPCGMVRANCKGNHEKAGVDFFDQKCGPLIEDCGCEVDRQCSNPEALACYDEWKASKEGIACYFRSKYRTQNDKRACWEAVKGKGGK